MDIYAHALDRGQQTAADKMQSILTAKPKERETKWVDKVKWES
jgi:hypothetical protein